VGKPTEAPKTVVNVAPRSPLEPTWPPVWPPVRVILRVIFITLAVASTLWILSKLTTVILLLVLSIFFAYLVSPLVEILHRPRRVAGRQIALPRVLAIVLSYLLILASILAVIYFVVPQLASQFPQFAEQAQSYSKVFSLKTQQLNEYFKQHKMPGAIVNGIDNVVPIVLEKISAGATVLLASVAGWVVFVPWIILIPILSFFLLKDADSFRRSALQMLPRGRWRWRGDEFFQDVNSTLAAYTRAQLTACMFIGSVCAGGFAVIGLPSPLVLGLIAGLLEFVPLIGPLTMAILAALVAIFHSGPSSALVVLIFLGVLRILQDYIIYPRLIGHGIHLHPLAIIIAILSGAELAGVTGIFLAIPVVAIVTVSYRHWMEHRGSEGLADLLEDDLNAIAADLTELIPAAVAETRKESDSGALSTHPTSATTAAEMTRARPDLTTGELKMPLSE
jgi:predicted PurR-regulated permease PerM